jgi:hypothetical protein
MTIDSIHLWHETIFSLFKPISWWGNAYLSPHSDNALMNMINTESQSVHLSD